MMASRPLPPLLGLAAATAAFTPQEDGVHSVTWPQFLLNGCEADTFLDLCDLHAADNNAGVGAVRASLQPWERKRILLRQGRALYDGHDKMQLAGLREAGESGVALRLQGSRQQTLQTAQRLMEVAGAGKFLGPEGHRELAKAQAAADYSGVGATVSTLSAVGCIVSADSLHEAASRLVPRCVTRFRLILTSSRAKSVADALSRLGYASSLLFDMANITTLAVAKSAERKLLEHSVAAPPSPSASFDNDTTARRRRQKRRFAKQPLPAPRKASPRLGTAQLCAAGFILVVIALLATYVYWMFCGDFRTMRAI